MSDASHNDPAEPAQTAGQTATKPVPNWRPWLVKGAFESALSILSVIVAMAVSQWADDQKTAARVKEMRGFLRAEIQANRDLIAHPDALPHHERLKQVFGESMGSLEAPVSREAAVGAARSLFATGLHPTHVSDAVWTSLSGGELMEHMDPREVFMLAALYRDQGNLDDVNLAGYEAATGLVELLATGEDAKVRLMRTLLMLEDMVAQERRLIALYDQALAELDDAPRVVVSAQSKSGTNRPGDAAPAKS